MVVPRWKDPCYPEGLCCFDVKNSLEHSICNTVRVGGCGGDLGKKIQSLDTIDTLNRYID